MSIQLEAIAFNHDPASATHDALNLRVNATRIMTPPEWRRGLTVIPEDSIAAYALNETRGNTLTLRASFRRLSPVVDRVEVRAIADQPSRDLSWIAPLLSYVARFYPSFYPYYYYYLWHVAVLDAISAAAPRVLGDVAGREIEFGPSDTTPLELFELENTDMADCGVGSHTVVWRWQFRTAPSDPWTQCATTAHRVFTVLSVPNEPWQQTPFVTANTQLPWSDVLEHACRWASGATDVDQAARRITRAVNRLGESIFEYGCPIGGLTQYTGLLLPHFYCTAFLDRVRGGPGNGVFINCSDCAAVVSTFSNALGCDLWQSRMGTGFTFELNPVLTIGSEVWRPACGWIGFVMHEVAWKFPCGAGDDVFDASLQVDADPVPRFAPHVALLPAQIAFGQAGDGNYLDRLTTPAGRPFCRPQPLTRVRRFVL